MAVSLFRRIVAGVVGAVGISAALVPGSSPASADPGDPSVTVLSPVADSTVSGEVVVTVAVQLGGAPSGHLDVAFRYNQASSEITEGSCDTGCQVEVTVPVNAWDSPLAGWVLLSARLTTSDGRTGSDGHGVYVSAPPGIADLAIERDGELFDGAVLAGRATVRSTLEVSAPTDAVAEMRLVDRTGVVQVRAEAPFTVQRGIVRDAFMSLDVSAVADGNYRLESRARATDDTYGPGRSTWVTVTHANPATFTTGDDPTLVVGSAAITGNLTVTGPLVSGSRPGAARITVDGIERSVLLRPGWLTKNWQDTITPATQTVDFSMDGPQLSLGTHRLTFQLNDTSGRPIGSPVQRTFFVVQYKAKVTTPTLVVGRRSSISIAADAPAGRVLDTCSVGLTAPGATGQEVGWWSFAPTASFRTTAYATPRAAGQNVFTTFLHTTDGQQNLSQNATVYSARRASLTAPSLPYGSKSTARITVQDSKLLGSWSPAPAGVLVTLQRQTTGSTTWATVGSARTSTTGVAAVAFTSVANAHLRAVAASTVPAETVTTPSVAVTSAAVVRWRIAPLTAARARATTFEVAAAPYDVGAKAYLQVRRAGTSTWTSVRTVTVPTSTVARFSYAFPSSTTWAVRVVRGTTTLHNGGISSSLSVKVT